METKKTLKLQMFKAIDGKISLSEFESWLYEQECLVDNLDDELNLALFSFDYKATGAYYAFHENFKVYYSKSEFEEWKIKSNLISLVSGVREAYRDQILQDFMDLGCDGYEALQDLGYHLNRIQDFEYYGDSVAEVEDSMREEALGLFERICYEETQVDGFDLKCFPYLKDPKSAAEVSNEAKRVKKKWWGWK